jgi:hypothetical protein
VPRDEPYGRASWTSTPGAASDDVSEWHAHGRSGGGSPNRSTANVRSSLELGPASRKPTTAGSWPFETNAHVGLALASQLDILTMTSLTVVVKSLTRMGPSDSPRAMIESD